jgi:hypothetical protein
MIKSLFALLLTLLLVQASFAQGKPLSVPDSTQKIEVVEASCGLCKFGMRANDCSLAVRINGKSYFVDGTGIDDHGDAHAKGGFCEAIRKAEVQGEIVNNRYKVTYFKLLPWETKASD